MVDGSVNVHLDVGEVKRAHGTRVEDGNELRYRFDWEEGELFVTYEVNAEWDKNLTKDSDFRC